MRILLIGDRGKMGYALKEKAGNRHEIIGINSTHCDVSDFSQLENLIDTHRPEHVINTAAYLGIDPCEKESRLAFHMNTMLPQKMAKICSERSIILTHFSTDAVFDDRKQDYYSEADIPNPINIYGLTKYAGDCFVSEICDKYYIMRVGVVFGPSRNNNQFFEKMLQFVKDGAVSLQIAEDIVSSPTYSLDAAEAILSILENKMPYGLYHTSNEGKGSLHEAMALLVKELGWDVNVNTASHKEFPALGRKNTFTPLTSTKVKLRHWKEAIKEYARLYKGN